MATETSMVFNLKKVRNVLFDIAALAFIYLVPTLSHYFQVPLYLIEPMRLMLVLAIVHTSRRNAYLIALTLPLFSLLVSGHPVVYKTLIMTVELLVNVWLFYIISKQWKNMFGAMLLSIVFSKLLYYLLKFGLISTAVIDSGLISTPVYLQLIMSVVFSAYLALLFKRKAVSEDSSQV